MENSKSYFEDRISEKEEEQMGIQVEFILDLFALLKPCEKVQVKRALRNLDIF